MSLIRDPATITKVGRQMMTAGGDITYTRATLYGQDISHLTKDQLESLTSIGSPLMTVPVGISDKSDNGNGTTVVLEATFQNNNLKADLPYTAVGFFAKKGNDDEKLVLVGVANPGTYLVATPPDGIATDAADIKAAIAIGDATSVTAVVDPAGSVTPTELHNSITDVKTEMHTALDLKADKVDLEPLAKTADVQAGLDTKANKTAVDSDVKSINDTLATKADKQTVTDDLAKKADKTDVDAQIGTVNKSVSDLSDTVKANKDDTDKALATKADKATVESELSTKANQSDLDKTNAEVAKKANTTDVNSQLATKADQKDVTDALALKDDTADVDKKISNVTNSVNSLSSTVTSNKSATDTALGTKANANDVANSFEEVRNRVKKLEGQQELTAPDFNTLTSTGIYMIENPTNGKNGPSNGNWGTLVISRGTTGSDSRILQEYYPDSGDLPYFRMSGPGGVWRDWKQLSDQSEINSLHDAVNTKADKTALDAYAKSADVANDVKTLQDNINAKADAQTVSDAISKIDLTPFAKTADVNSALSGKADKTTIDSINKALASKRDITDSYSRDELDKKFLQLSADTGGKVSADQVSKLIAGKADQDDVDKKIKAVTDAVNTKANSSDVTSLINSNADKLTQAINAITYSAKERPLPSNDANEITKDGIYRVGGDPLKNGAGQQWDFLLVKKWDENTIYQMMYGGGKGIFIRNISKTYNSYPEWTRIDIDVNGLQNTLNAKANTADVDAKIKTVTDLANTKANSVDVYNKQAIDTAFSQRDSNITKAQNEVDQLKGRRQVDAQDFNNLTATGTYYVSNPGANKPTGSWGNLLVSNGDGHRTSQLYFPDDNSAPWYRTLDEGTWHDWTQLASASQVTNAQNTANSANTNANGRLSLGGGNMTLRSTINWDGGGIDDRTGNLGGLNWAGGTDYAKIYGDQDGSDNLDLAIDLGDDGSNHVSFRKNGSETSAITSDGHFTGTVDWGHVNGRPQDQVDRVNTITPLFRRIQNSNNWKDIFGVDNPNNVLTSLRINPGGSGPLINDFAAGIGFGGDDTKAVLSVDYGSHRARITGGNGTGPGWSEDIAWKSDVNDLRNQVQQLRESQFEVQTFTDATAAANWEAQRPGHRLAIVNK